MQLLLVRHGDAETLDNAVKAGRDEAGRELTDAGRTDLYRAARVLKSLLDIDVLASSPLVRAAQTAQLIAHSFDLVPLTLQCLAPGFDRAELLRWLVGQPERATCAVVGHEPDLGALAAWLVCGNVDARIELKKGAALLLAFDAAPAAGGAVLRWLLPLDAIGGIKVYREWHGNRS